MKERVGILLACSGCILLILPTIDTARVLMFIQLHMMEYWPICLVMIGFLMMQPKKKKTRTRN